MNLISVIRTKGKVIRIGICGSRPLINLLAMNILLNDETIELVGGSSVLELLNDKNLADKKGIALAINNTVIPKSTWAEQKIQENDHILIITATQGG